MKLNRKSNYKPKMAILKTANFAGEGFGWGRWRTATDAMKTQIVMEAMTEAVYTAGKRSVADARIYFVTKLLNQYNDAFYQDNRWIDGRAQMVLDQYWQSPAGIAEKLAAEVAALPGKTAINDFNRSESLKNIRAAAEQQVQTANVLDNAATSKKTKSTILYIVIALFVIVVGTFIYKKYAK